MGLPNDSILAGPLVRRAESSRVYIWMATDIDVTITGEIFAANTVLTGKYAPQLGRGEASSLQFGKGLFVTLVLIEPLEIKGVPNSKSFPTDQLLAYDLMIRERDKPYAAGKRLSYFFPDMEDPQSGIAYPGLKLPTFYLASLAAPLNILHGSCRKFHGEQGDALVFADQVVAKNLGIPVKKGQRANIADRPSALVLTGDQIYADDVAEPLVDGLLSLQRRLLGWIEVMPPRDKGGPPLPRTLYYAWGPQLEGIFTSEEKQNQLVSFGDFAAMYLMSLGPKLWPSVWPMTRSVPGVAGARYTPKASDADWRGQVYNLERYKSTLPAVRRLLANIPSYMIFDDHEVTDDWNLYERFVTNVKKSPLAQRVVANALAAYWLFQAWGDAPDLFKDLADPITKSLKSEGRSEDFDKAMLDHGSWAFVAPTAPPIVFIDSRTQRGFDADPKQPGESTKAPRLINAHEAAYFTRLGKQALTSSPQGLLIIVAATPPFGVEAIEKLQQYLLTHRLSSKLPADPALRAAKLDNEAWHANLGGFVDLLAAIGDAQPRSLLILSGDVHYSFVTRVGMLTKSPSGKIPALQFTSSSLKNAIVSESRGLLKAALKTDKMKFPIGPLDVWRKPVHVPALQEIRALGGGSDQSNADLTKRFLETPVIVSHSLAHRLGAVDPDFQLTFELVTIPDNQMDGPILWDTNLGQLLTDGRAATTIWYAVWGGSAQGVPRTLKFDLTTIPKS